MRLLIVTQKVDATDANLGFFVRWIEKLAEYAEITVIANEVGRHALPSAQVRVLSLGKERGASRFGRFFRYQKLLWCRLPQTDGVFFHMCPEYVLGAHFLPRIFRTKTLLWYVHKEVSWRLRLAALFVDKIFTASKESCRLRSRKVEVVGHGIASNTNYPSNSVCDGLERASEQDTKLRKGTEAKAPHLFTAGRIAPVKDLRTLILGFLALKKKLPEATFSIVGEPITEQDRAHLEDLRRISSGAQFIGGVSHGELPRLLADATVFVHASRTGSMDKAVLEALAAGLPVFTSNEAFTEDMGVRKFRQGDASDFAEKISRAFSQGELVINTAGSAYVRENHSLSRLIQNIVAFYA